MNLKKLVALMLIVPSLSFATSWKVNLQDTDINLFVQQVAKQSGKTFIVDPRVKGKVSVVTEQELDSEGLYDLLLSVLNVHGFAAVESNGVIKIVPSNTAKQAGTSFVKDEKNTTDLIVTKVIPIHKANAADLVPVIRPLIPQYGHLAAIATQNALIISDHASNISQIESLVSTLDKVKTEEIAVLSLAHAWSTDIIEIIENLQGTNGGVGAPQGSSPTRIIADDRTNRLIIKGSKSDVNSIKAMVVELDTPARSNNRINVIPLRYADATKVSELLSGLLSGQSSSSANQTSGNGTSSRGISIVADEDQNNLVVMATPSQLVDIQSVVNKLDLPRAQVLVEAIIVEVNMGNSDAFSFQWLFGDTTSSTMPALGTNFSNGGSSLNNIASSVATGIPSLSNGITALVAKTNALGNINLAGVLQAIETNSDANLLSAPKLLTLDNQKARILVGETRPFQTGAYAESSSNAFVTTTREDIGLTLEVTPQINANDEVKMQVIQTVESASNEQNQLGTVTSKREIETTVVAGNRSTVVLGGLIQDNVTSREEKVPLLGDIPVVGKLFRSEYFETEKRNLMVFIRPTILRTQAEATDVANQRFQAFKTLEIAQGSLSKGLTLDQAFNPSGVIQ